MRRPGRAPSGVLLVLVLLLVGSLAVVPGVAAAARTGGTVVVDGAAGDVTATGGTVVVRGTVAGDLEAYGVAVVVGPNATVTGSLTAYAGSVRVEGTVGRNVVASGGAVVLGPDASVGGSLGALAGEATVAGRVAGDVTAGPGSLAVASTARVGGDVRYDGEATVADGARVDGRVRRVSEADVGPPVPDLPRGTLAVYGLLANLLLGGLLLRGLGGFSRSVVEGAVLAPAGSLAYGLAAVVAAPVGLLALAVTVVGLPVAVAALLALPAVGWVGAVYGRFALGAWLVSYADVDTPWVGLVVGVTLVAVLAQAPYAGPAVRVLVTLLGLGSLAAELDERLGEDWRL